MHRVVGCTAEHVQVPLFLSLRGEGEAVRLSVEAVMI